MYTAIDFRNELATDIWVLEQMNNLPHDPPQERTEIYDEKTGMTTTSVTVVETLQMPFAQDEVIKYRNRLVPVFFTLAQKVYAEFFRVVLGQNPPLPSNKSNKQVDSQKKVRECIDSNLASLTVTPVFSDRQEFDDWWKGHFQYEDLRLARNEVVHNKYDFDGSRLLVQHSNGTLNMTVDEVLSFAGSILAKAKTV